MEITDKAASGIVKLISKIKPATIFLTRWSTARFGAVNFPAPFRRFHYKTTELTTMKIKPRQSASPTS